MRKPARTIRPSHRALTGLIVSDGTAKYFESALERDFLLLLDFNRMVQEFHTQPVTIPYELGGQSRRYTPDVHAIYFGAQPSVYYEVKYREQLREEWAELRPRFKAAIRYAKSEGASFKIVTEKEIRTPMLQNIKFLRRCQNQVACESIEEQVVRTLAILGESTPATLVKASFSSERNRQYGLSALWRMVAAGRIEADLESPLSMQTPIWVEVGEGFRAIAPPYPP